MRFSDARIGIKVDSHSQHRVHKTAPTVTTRKRLNQADQYIKTKELLVFSKECCWGRDLIA